MFSEDTNVHAVMQVSYCHPLIAILQKLVNPNNSKWTDPAAPASGNYRVWCPQKSEK